VDPGGVYGPFLHPWSTGKHLYCSMSLWSAYDAMLMATVPPKYIRVNLRIAALTRFSVEKLQRENRLVGFDGSKESRPAYGTPDSGSSEMTTASDDAVTAGALLGRLRAMAVDRLRSAGPSTDLRVVAMPGSGTVKPAKVAGTKFSWWKKTSSTGPFALCYAVAAHTSGKPVSKYQASGCRWGWANSYATGAKDVAFKAKTLSNGPWILRDGSVFLSPAYVVFQKAGLLFRARRRRRC